MKKLLLVIAILFIMTMQVFAAPDPNIIIKKGYDNPYYMNQVDNNVNFGITIKNVTRLLGTVGIGIGTCVGIIYAIMWVTATPQKKADLKERIFPLVLGVILLFGGSGFAAKFISGIAKIL